MHKLEEMLKHENYSPRHVDYFINRICSEQFIREHDVDPYSFLDIFRRYLNKPISFWEELFNKQTPTGRLILLVLLISNDPMSLEDLRSSFLSLQLSVREQLNLEILPLQFESEIKVLEELFIRTELSEMDGEILVYFQSAGIKDFLLEYLRKNIESWGNPLISNAWYFNQLFFVFTTHADQEIDDFDSDLPLFGNKIILSPLLQKSLKKRVISDFYSLPFSTVAEWWNLDKVGRHADSADSKYWKLSILCRSFNIHTSENEELRAFVLSEIVRDINQFSNEGGKIVSRGSMDLFPGFVNLFKKEFSSFRKELIQAYYDSITFTGEFISFLAFKQIFPIEYDRFLRQRLTEIRKKIKTTILDDIEFFLDDGVGGEIDQLFEFEIPEVFKSYGLRMSKKFQQEIGDASEGEISYRKKRSDPTPKRQKSKRSSQRTKARPSSLRRVINEYLTESALKPRFNYRRAVKESNLDSPIRQKLLRLKDDSELINSLFSDEISFSLLVESLKSTCVDSISEWTVLESIGETQISRIHESLGGFSREETMEIFCSLAFDIFQSESKTATSKSVERQIRNFLPTQNVVLSNLSPLIVKRGNWYEFLNTAFLYFFLSKKLINQTKERIFYEELYEIIGSDYGGSSILSLLGETCPGRLNDWFFAPMKAEMLEAFGDNSEHEIVTRFFDYFELKCDFAWNKRRKMLDECGWSNTRGVEEVIMGLDSPDFDLWELESFFINENHKNSLRTLSYNATAYNQLYERAIRFGQFEAESESRCSHHHLALDLKKFVREKENYDAMRAVGLVDYIISAVSSLRNSCNPPDYQSKI